MSLILSSCLSFNKPEIESSNSPIPIGKDSTEISTNTKIQKGLLNFSGQSFSLEKPLILKINSDNNPPKLSATTLVVLGDGKDLLVSGPGSIINNKSIVVKKKYSFFEVKEKYKTKIISSIVNSPTEEFLHYKLAL